MEALGEKLCECPCGNPAPVAKRNDKRWGHVKGKAVRFISGHNSPTHLCHQITVLTGVKRCCGCNLEKSVNDFRKPNTQCRECERKNWRRLYAEGYYRKYHNLKTEYEITRQRKVGDELRDEYIKRLLGNRGFKAKEVTKKLIDVTRMAIAIGRFVREVKKSSADGTFGQPNQNIGKAFELVKRIKLID